MLFLLIIFIVLGLILFIICEIVVKLLFIIIIMLGILNFMNFKYLVMLIVNIDIMVFELLLNFVYIYGFRRKKYFFKFFVFKLNVKVFILVKVIVN